MLKEEPIKLTFHPFTGKISDKKSITIFAYPGEEPPYNDGMIEKWLDKGMSELKDKEIRMVWTLGDYPIVILCEHRNKKENLCINV